MNIPKRFIAAALFLSFAGCSTVRFDWWPGKSSSEPAAQRKPAEATSRSAQPSNIQLPIKGQLVVSMAPQDLKKQTKLTGGGANSEFWFEEGKLIQRAALKAFGGLVEHVSQGQERGSAYPVARVQGKGTFNPTMGTYYADVVVTLSSASGDALGKFEAESSADGRREAAFAAAYDAAFQNIVEQLVKNAAFVAAIQQEASKPRPEAAGAQPGRVAPSQSVATSKSAEERSDAARSSKAAEEPSKSASFPKAVEEPSRSAGPSKAAEGPSKSPLFRWLSDSLGWKSSKAAEEPSKSSSLAKAAQKPSGFVRPSEIQLPIKGDLMVYMAPEDLTKRSRVLVGAGYADYWFEEGKLVQRSAIRAFGKYFERVTPSQEDAAPYLGAEIKGESGFNPIMGIYYANVAVAFTAANGDALGTLEAEASTGGQGENGFAKAYDAAFQNIGRQLLNDGTLMAKVLEEATRPKEAASAAGSAKEEISQPVKLPNSTPLLIYMAPQDLDKQSKLIVGGGYPDFWYEEGKLIQSAAIKAFGKLFGQVSPGKERGSPYPVAKVQGSSSFNPMMERYYARVTVTFFSPNGRSLGKFEAESSASGRGATGFSNAYDAAFQEIVDRLLKAGQL